MRFIGICLIAGAAGCAAQPFMPSNEQRALFNDVVRQAEAAGAVSGSPEAARCLANAKSDFEYAQHIPRYPDQARQVAAKAQEEGAEALRLAQEHRRQMAALAREGAHVEAAADIAADVTTTAATPVTTAPEKTDVADTIAAAPEAETISPKGPAIGPPSAAGEIAAHADN